MPDEHQRLVEDAIWSDVADEVIKDFTPMIQHLFSRRPKDKEILGRYIVRERARKYREGIADGR